MSWLRRYHLRRCINNSTWLFSVVSIFVAMGTVSLLSRIELAMGGQLNVTREMALAVMATIASSTFSLVVVVSFGNSGRGPACQRSTNVTDYCFGVPSYC